MIFRSDEMVYDVNADANVYKNADAHDDYDGSISVIYLFDYSFSSFLSIKS